MDAIYFIGFDDSYKPIIVEYGKNDLSLIREFFTTVKSMAKAEHYKKLLEKITPDQLRIAALGRNGEEIIREVERMGNKNDSFM